MAFAAAHSTQGTVGRAQIAVTFITTKGVRNESVLDPTRTAHRGCSTHHLLILPLLHHVIRLMASAVHAHGRTTQRSCSIKAAAEQEAPLAILRAAVCIVTQPIYHFVQHKETGNILAPSCSEGWVWAAARGYK